MEPMDVERIQVGRVERYFKDELVVALPHLSVVWDRLTKLGVSLSEKDKDEKLGLARLGLLDGIDKAITALRKHPDIDRKLRQLEDEYPPNQNNQSPPKLDLLLRGFRAQFAEDYASWMPEIGKSRLLDQGLPHLGGGGVGFPERAERDEVSGGSGPSARVAVLDTTVFPRPELKDNVFAKIAAVMGPVATAAASFPEPMKANEGHGTFVAGLIVRRAPRAQLELHQVLDEDAQGDGWDAAKQLVRLAGTGVDIINMSFGALTDDGQPPLVLARAIEQLSPEIVMVAAAGNHGDLGGDRAQQAKRSAPMWPAAFDDVIAVASGHKSDNGTGLELSSFSPRAPWVDLVALGEKVTSSYLSGKVIATPLAPEGSSSSEESLGDFDGYATWSGTSFAAAIVSGLIAADTDPGRISAREALNGLSKGLPGLVRQFSLNDLP